MMLHGSVSNRRPHDRARRHATAVTTGVRSSSTYYPLTGTQSCQGKPAGVPQKMENDVRVAKSLYSARDLVYLPSTVVGQCSKLRLLWWGLLLI